jgi:hypothetical protein
MVLIDIVKHGMARMVTEWRRMLKIAGGYLVMDGHGMALIDVEWLR